MLDCKVQRSVYLAGGADAGNGRIKTVLSAHFSLNHLLVVSFELSFSLRTRAVQERVEERPLLNILNIQRGRGRQLHAWLRFLFSYCLPRLSRPNDSSAVFASPLVPFRHYISNPLVRYQLFRPHVNNASWICTFFQTPFTLPHLDYSRLAIQTLSLISQKPAPLALLSTTVFTYPDQCF